MNIPGNRFSDIKRYFTEELSGQYDPGELLVVFRLAACHINGFSPIHLHLQPNDRVTESELLKYHRFVKRLKNNEPVQYIMGYTWFMDLKIKVNSSVLIPRPETEELVNDLLQRAGSRNPVVLDACTGSGCIALAVKHYLPEATVLACDLSEEALETAQENARENKLDVSFFRADVLQAPGVTIPELDILVSNPPYIPQHERTSLTQQVKSEPSLALFVPDDDPLRFYHALARWGNTKLKPGGLLLAECHRQYADDVNILFTQQGFNKVELFRDLSGAPRWVSACKL